MRGERGVGRGGGGFIYYLFIVITLARKRAG